MNSVEELSTTTHIQRLPVNTFKTAATTYDFPEHPPKKEKKWSFGNLFRRKKKEETDSSSDEELQKKQPANSKKKRKQDRRKKLGTFDHIVVNNGYSRYEDVGVLSDPSGGNYAGRPLPKIPSEDKERQGSFESVRRSYRARAAARRGGKDGSSSDEDSQRSFSSSSLNNRRDGSLSRRSRVARTERYIRRLSKDDETILNREALQRQTKENWDLNIKPTENLSGLFTIPPSHNYNRYHQQQRGFNTANPNHQEANSAEVFHESSPKTNCFNVRSLSCDSNIHKSPSPEVMHVQFPIGRVRKVIEPPPPPPRDPRRVAAVPSSHCFDKILQRNNYKPNSNWHAGYRTASEDHIPTEPRQPLAPRPASVTNENRQPRYIKRHVQESADRFQYLTEKKPRSRKPIFIQSTDKINTANFTKTTNHANPIDITRTGNPNTSFHKSTPPKFIPGHTNGIPSSPNPKETYSTSFNSNSSLYSNSPSFNHASPSSLNRNHSQKLPDHTYSNTRGGSFNRTTPKQDFTDFKRTDSQNSINFWKRKEIENSPSSKSTSSSPQMFTAQTHVQTKIFLPSVIQEPESTDTVDFIQRNASPFKPISSPSLADRKNEITSSVDSLSNEFKSEDVKRKSANLEEALDELEAIYKSLHLGDEDLLERAEQREMSIAAQKMMESNMEMYPGSRGALSDSSFSYEPYHSLDNPRKKKLKKSQTLDRKNDDMAYRKMNKDRAHTIGNPQSVIASVSYLLASPVHCPADNESIVDPDDEPDITLDDVVYRSIKHANNSLKVADPQPPFGIPIGPIAPAPNSDYLHAVPENTIEFTFKHKKIPDVVKDDLAFRNLRKDSNKEHKLPNDEPSHEQVFRNLNKSSIRSPRRNTQECTYHQNNSPMKNLEEEANANKKRRAVRSLSANISNIMNQEYSEFNQSSLTDIADAMEIARQILKEKENKITSTKRAFLSDSETKYRKPYVQSASSTETITESRLNFLNEMRNKDLHLLNEDYLHAKPPRGSSPARRQSKESTPVPTSAEEKEKITSFEDMLTALAVEARETSDRITKELMDDDLNLNNKLKGDKKEEDKSDVKMVTNNVSKVHAYEDVHSSILDFNKEMKMLDENLRKHEQALSSRLSKNSDVKIIGQAESMLSKNTDARISGKAIEGAFSLEQDEKPEERGSKSNVDVKPEEKSPSPYPRSLLKSKVHTEVGSSSAHRGDNLRKLEEPVRNLVIGEENLSEAQKKTDGNQDIDKYLTVDDHDFQKLVDNMKNPEPLKSADDSEHEINFNTELEMLDRNLNNTQSKNDLDSRLSEIDAVSEHAKMCEKLFECVVESTELIAATKTESNPVEEVENIETLIPESVANIVTTRNVEEVKDALNFEIHSNSEEEGDYENLGSDSELGKSSKSPFEEHKAELIATFKKLDKFSEDLECRLSAPLAEDEIESCDEEILNTVNEYKTTKETNDVKDGESSSSKYEDPDGKSSSSKYEDYGANSSSSKYEDLDGKSSSEINTKPSDAEAKGGEECVLATALPERAFVCKTTINIPATYTTNCDIYVSDSHSESGFHSNSSCTDSTSCAESNVEHLSDTVDQIPSLLLESLKSPMLVKETSRRLSTAKEDKKDGSALRPSCSSGNEPRCRGGKSRTWYGDPIVLAFACSYGVACSYQLVSLDVVAILGLLFVIISIAAALILE